MGQRGSKVEFGESIQITGGPSKYDLVGSLMDKEPVTFRVLTLWSVGA